MIKSQIKLSEPMYTPKQTLDQVLFPVLQPYSEGTLQVSPLHTIWYAQYGNPDGVPVVVLHGGPGIGCSPNDMRFFDPAFYRIINLDQRGAKRSTPFGETRENSTPELIKDIESIRELLKINKWLVFGGSWGSALSLLYGEAHPECCLGFVLRGIFLARRKDADNLWFGMRDTFPEEWDKMYKFLPEAEREELVVNFFKRVMDPDPSVNIAAARAFMEYDLKAGALVYSTEHVNKTLADEKQILGATRMFSFYYKNNFFIKENQILDNIDKIEHLPASIVHGRYDIICRLQSGFELYQCWPGSELLIVQDAGHTTFEPAIAKGLIEATERMKTLIN